MTDPINPQPVPQPQPQAQPQALPLPLPHPLGQLASLPNLGNAGILIAAVGLMWARIDSIESRFDDLDIRIDLMAREVGDLSATMQVAAVQTITASQFSELERRVTIIESKL